MYVYKFMYYIVCTQASWHTELINLSSEYEEHSNRKRKKKVIWEQ